MASTNTIVQIFSITTSLIASGGIATISLFDIPELRSQPASRALPSIRWLFSRGSHLFPQAAVLSSAGFAYLAFASLGPKQSATQLLNVLSNSTTVNGYLTAAALSMSIGPFTTFVMIPTNFALIKMNEDLGGARSEKSERIGKQSSDSGQRSALDSVNGDGEAAEFTDLSGPQKKTPKGSSAADDEKMRGLLDKFSVLNWIRAGLIGSGGVWGLWVALS